MKSYRVVAMALALVFCLMVFLPTDASAQKLIGQLVKVFGIGYVVTQFGGEINKFINNLAGQKGVEWEGTTKVVPVVSVGQGGYIGAVQVHGPADRVQTVKAVAQVEASISSFRGKLLVPIDTTSASKNLTRVKGVGVAALIDFEI